MTELDCLSSEKKVQAALYSDVMTICKETFSHIGLNISQPAMMIIGDLVYKKLSIYGQDLEAFANHANRVFVNTDDVRLLVRRNPSLVSGIQARFDITKTMTVFEPLVGVSKKARLLSKCPDRPAAVEKRRKTTSNITSKKRKIDNPNNLPSTSRNTSPIL